MARRLCTRGSGTRLSRTPCSVLLNAAEMVAGTTPRLPRAGRVAAIDSSQGQRSSGPRRPDRPGRGGIGRDTARWRSHRSSELGAPSDGPAGAPARRPPGGTPARGPGAAKCRRARGDIWTRRRPAPALLERDGQVIAVEADRWFDRASVDEMVGRLRSEMKPGQEHTPAELRDILGFSRKFLIPFLEYCDRHHITERRSSGRVLLGP